MISKQINNYETVFVPEDECGFSVSVPALPGCFTQGETMEEATLMAEEAIELYLQSLKEDSLL